MLCEKAKTGKSDAMQKCECDAKMREKFASHRIAKNGGKTGKLIDRSLFRNRIRIALPAPADTRFQLLFLGLTGCLQINALDIHPIFSTRLDEFRSIHIFHGRIAE
jgi:hypothetical protein